MHFRFEQLKMWGWNSDLESHFESYDGRGSEPGRVTQENKHFFQVQTAAAQLLSEVSGKLRFEAGGREQLPAVGDWVVVRSRPKEGRGTIHAVLPRKSQFVRKEAGRRMEAQVVGSNIDWVLVMTSLNQDFNLRRLERYLVLAWESGVSPVLVLSKADLCPDAGPQILAARAQFPSVPIHAISVLADRGLEVLAPYFGAGKTVALLGSSGVGKSTLINRLLGAEALKTQEVRLHDDRGRHTTSHRQLMLVPGGALVLDTPGMRELQLWGEGNGMHSTFEEIEVAAGSCRFRNCTHQHEPGCAVREALEEGSLDRSRYENYEKLQRELKHLSLQEDRHAQQKERRRWKSLSRMARDRAAMKRSGG